MYDSKDSKAHKPAHSITSHELIINYESVAGVPLVLRVNPDSHCLDKRDSSPQRVRPYGTRSYACEASYVRIRQHTSAYVSIRQHTSAYVRYACEASRTVKTTGES
jgi:hypothetical protein